MPPLPRPLATRLLLIRTALLAGLLLFGAVTWYLQRDGSVAAMPADRARLHGYVFMAMAAAALIGLLALRARIERGAPEATMAQLYIAGYGMADAAALFGAVTWYIGGSQNWYIAGLVLMVAAFQILPIKREN